MAGAFNGTVGATTPATGAFTTATVSGDLTVDTSTLKVDSANNFVGIGTATPVAPLSIGSGNNTLGALTKLWIEGTGAATMRARIALGVDSNLDYGGYVASHSYGGGIPDMCLVLGTRGNASDYPTVYVKDNKVGILKDTPASTLDVAGTIAGTSSLTLGTASATAGTVVLKNATNAFTTTLTPAVVAADRAIAFPDAAGTLLLSDGSGANLTTLNASNVSSGTLAAARMANAGVHTGDATGTFPAITLNAAQTGITSAANLATVGTITSGVWNAGAVTSSGVIQGTGGIFLGMTYVRSSAANYSELAFGVDTANNYVFFQSNAAGTGVIRPFIIFRPGTGNAALTVATGGGVTLANATTLSSTLAVTGATTLTGNLTSNGAYISTPQALSGNGAVAAVNLTTEVTTIANTGTANTTTTLAAGTNGQKKVISFITDGGFDAVITVTNPAWGGAGTITMNDALDNIELRYLNSVWQVFINNGCTLA
jgi:hypothetical protein